MLSGEWIEIRRIGMGFSAIWRVDWNTENRNGIIKMAIHWTQVAPMGYVGLDSEMGL